MLTQEQARSALCYDPETGIVTWRIRTSQRSLPGATVGGKDIKGYRTVKLYGKTYKVHRIVWLYMTGKWPREEIDHINGVRDDNRWQNLREASHAFNSQNRRRVLSRHGFLGVYKHRRKFGAQIEVNGKNIYLGYFSTAELAHAAYVEAKRKLHPGNTL